MITRIEISSKLKKQIAKEFDTTVQAVRMSLQYVFNSEQAKSIRKRAKELLLEEVAKIEKGQKEFEKQKV